MPIQLSSDFVSKKNPNNLLKEAKKLHRSSGGVCRHNQPVSGHPNFPHRDVCPCRANANNHFCIKGNVQKHWFLQLKSLGSTKRCLLMVWMVSFPCTCLLMYVLIVTLACEIAKKPTRDSELQRGASDREMSNSAQITCVFCNKDNNSNGEQVCALCCNPH